MCTGVPTTSGINEHLGRRLRQRRRLLGLTQRALAESDGLRFQQIQKYECGANAMSAERLWRLATLLDTPILYFFQGLGERAAWTLDGAGTDGPEGAEFARVCAGLDLRARRSLLALMQSMNTAAAPLAATGG